MGSGADIIRLGLIAACVLGAWSASVHEASNDDNEMEALEGLIRKIGIEEHDVVSRVKRGAGDKGVT